MGDEAEERELPIRAAGDLPRVRQAVAAAMAAAGAGTLQRTRLVTAASELARNALVHGGGGRVTVRLLRNASRSGVALVVSDAGPGIADVELALRDGFSTGSGLGLGLGGARRLCDEFAIDTGAGRGTTVRVATWVRRR